MHNKRCSMDDRFLLSEMISEFVNPKLVLKRAKIEDRPDTSSNMARIWRLKSAKAQAL
jgi:hypothetical protein